MICWRVQFLICFKLLCKPFEDLFLKHWCDLEIKQAVKCYEMGLGWYHKFSSFLKSSLTLSNLKEIISDPICKRSEFSCFRWYNLNCWPARYHYGFVVRFFDHWFLAAGAGIILAKAAAISKSACGITFSNRAVGEHVCVCVWAWLRVCVCELFVVFVQVRTAIFLKKCCLRQVSFAWRMYTKHNTIAIFFGIKPVCQHCYHLLSFFLFAFDPNTLGLQRLYSLWRWRKVPDLFYLFVCVWSSNI